MERHRQPPCEVRMVVRMTAGHRAMLEWLSAHQHRTMNNVIRLAIQRVYEAERAAELRASGKAQGFSGVTGRT